MDDRILLSPTNLALFVEQVSAYSGRPRGLLISEIRMGHDLLDDPLWAIFDGDSPAAGGVLIVYDSTKIYRKGELLKPAVVAALRAGGAECSVLELEAAELHTTPKNILLVKERLSAGMEVVALGSGTIADIVKHAVYEFEREAGDALVLTIVQTANSVCAFTSGLSVITTDGVKRTVPSRLPNRLVLDTTVLAQAPRNYTLGGIGDASVAASSIADYRLASMLEVGDWDPVAWKVVEDGRQRFLDQDPALADPGATGAERLALDLSACGLAMTFAGESAPVSGLEHVTSHMLDLSAEYFRRDVGNHGSQCGLATTLVLIAFEHLLALDLDSLQPRFLSAGLDLKDEEQSVRRAFGDIDPSGAIWRECWSDYRLKLETWSSRVDAVSRFRADWPRNQAELRGYLADPEEFLSSLAVTGHPLFFEDITPGISEQQALWAFRNARLMRKRISIADVLYFFGLWNDEFVEAVFERFRSIRANILDTSGKGAQQ